MRKKAITSKELGKLAEKTLSEVVAGQGDPKVCPNCGSKNTLYRKTDKIHWCRRCPTEWSFEIKEGGTHE